ncbi:unnamed protein product, partial [Trichobilharzia szidati]
MDPLRLEKLMEQQLKLMEMLAGLQISRSADSSTANDSIGSSISEFVYDPDANVTFDTWFRRYEDLFRVDFADKDDAWKVRLLLRKLGSDELDKYCNLILPQKPSERSFDETVHTLRHQFGDQRSLFNIRYHCMKLSLNENDDIHTQLGIVNRTCERFKLKSLSEDQFKVLIFICGLQSPKFADIRTRLLNRLEQDPRMTLKDVGEEYQRLINIHNDTALVQSGSQNAAEVHAVHSVPSTSTAPRHPQHKPPSACWHCGSWHFANLCPFKQHKCRRCHTVGHKDGYCKRNNRPRSRSRPKRRNKPKSL